ncbi:alpha/beta hydrolase family protein [Poritiphilus flavus]|uniref:Alpha/beta fold hydrolase n=1 Tax=Poritiphilus flavus TaxID=2697053 RepID=A0A6L9EFZ8_9FLAO|nr:alpha/beta fold hydrolase [Poritiphilus flavus]NAS13667.1 alpha/beta fold hydrolase [Poritiphilus flavus]
MKNHCCLIAAVLFVVMTGNAQMGTVTKSKVLSDSTRLMTRMILPEKPLKKKPPVLVIVHGSGNQGSWNTYIPMISRFSAQGFAVVFFDKRGTGDSEGVYEEVTAENSEDVFERLSNDVVSVSAWAKKQARIDTARVGLLAYSEGGWVAPLALSKSDDLKFAAILSGPLCTVGQELLFTELQQKAEEVPEITLDSIYKSLADFTGKAGFDSRPLVESMETPGFWLFGGKDQSMAVDFSKAQLAELMKKSPEIPIRFKVYPNANHSLYDAETKERMPYAEDIRDWVLECMYE